MPEDLKDRVRRTAEAAQQLARRIRELENALVDDPDTTLRYYVTNASLHADKACESMHWADERKS